MNKARLTTALLAGVLLAGTTVLAHPPASKGPAGFKQASRPPAARMHLMRMAWVLDLSPEQKEQMWQLLQEQREQFRQLRQQQRETRLAIRSLEKNGSVDAKALNSLLDQAASLYRQQLEMRIHVHEALQAILTEEQREQWQQWRQEHPRRRHG